MILSLCFNFGLLNTSEKLKSFCFQEVAKGYIDSTCVNKAYALYVGLHTLHGKFYDFHFLTSLWLMLVF